MLTKGYSKQFWVAAWSLGFVLTGCGDSGFSRETLHSPFAALAGKGALLEQTQTPWHLTVEGLSEEKLYRLGHASEAVFPAAASSAATTTVAVKLRLQSQDSKLPVAELLQLQAPTYSPEQAQNALFYHMAEAGYLQLTGTSVHPVTAYVEMTTQRDQCVDIVFIFSLARPVLEQARTAEFILDKAFFLSQPVEFALPAAQLLPAS